MPSTTTAGADPVSAPTPFTTIARDGTALGGALARTALPRRGVVLVRTPYDARVHLGLARSLAGRGFDCLVQDVRGRYSSAGVWVPYADEAKDGVATVDALLAHGLTGPVVAYGASYAAHAAVELARVDPRVRRVVALVPALGLYETAYAADGTPQYRDRLGWWAIHGFARESARPLPARALTAATEVAEKEGPLAAAARLGWRGRRLEAFRRLWEAKPVDLVERYGGVAADLLLVTGDADSFDGHARGLATAWGVRSGSSRGLVSGPWGHDLGIGTADETLRKAYATAGPPGRLIADWLSGGGPEPGHEMRLDVAKATWTTHDLPVRAALKDRR